MKKDITLVKYSSTDFENYKKLAFDEEIMSYSTGRKLSQEEAKSKFASLLTVNRLEANLGYYKINNGNGELIGDCKLIRYKYDHTILEIGYVLKKEYRGQGLGNQICQSILKLANDHHPTTDIIALIDPDNIASKKLLEKFSFKSFFNGTEYGLLTEKLILKMDKN
ncbi:GNAT family N-acetyltransferase [Sphingobacterium yanglingense]|uniref:Ribosomal-protein-alanine N-acetyltransferase n=1 Tax=Sphingobacterium yanglingense TaxID=1437280 RepID=A0A4R6WGV1_9SPHI|nr:GNAT family N-acetyltransferase [Sphingobacterium yanglingense]TDQ79344.1 ribosomal-protein-alanine N-acetyltransferase [Sphingobacterium yanglingense]